jgi:hypothetical protein
MKKKHRLVADRHTETFLLEVIAKWQQMIKEWDDDHSKPDPYQEPEACKPYATQLFSC